MAPGFPTVRLLRESAPVAVVLLFWTVLSSPMPRAVAGSVRTAGLVMALLYVVVRGAGLAQALPTVPEPDGPLDVLAESVGVAVGAGAWFLAALVVVAIDSLWSLVGLPGAFTSPVEELASLFATTGLATVLLYAVAIGLPRVRRATTGRGSNGGPTGGGVSPADD